MGSKHIICSNFCKELFLEDIAKATSVIARSYFYSKDKKIILQNKKITKSKTYLSQSIFVFQCHHGIRETFPEKTKKFGGNFKGLHWLFPTVFSLTVKVTILSAIFSGLTDLNSSLTRQSLLMSTLPVNEFITVFTTSVISCIPSG